MPQPPPIQLDVRLEFLTPTVLGGARPRQVDPYMPLRPTSLRGLWRYWFRALASSLMWPERSDREGSAMVRELLGVERSLFGDTTRRSRLVVLPPQVDAPRGKSIPYTFPIPKATSGLRYLGYGLFDDRSKRPPECIPDGATAKLSCVLHSPRNDFADLRAVLATLWVWTAVGGIGGRSRRGWGSLALTGLESDGPPELAAVLKPWQKLIEQRTAPKDHLAALRDGIGLAQDALMAFLKATKQGRRQLEGDSGGPHKAIRSLDGLAEAAGLSHTYKSGVDALDHAGELFRNFRSSLSRSHPLPDYAEVKGFLKDGIPPRHIVRAAFGLPLNFYFRSLGGDKASVKADPPGDDTSDRLASPLFFRVYKLRGDKYGVALINLAGKASAPPLQGARLIATPKRGSSARRIPEPANQLIVDFIEWARTQPPPRAAHRQRRQ